MTDRKEHRRTRLAALMGDFGTAALSEKTGIPAAMLYQMSKGRGKSKRNVNDDQARVIERAAGKPMGWLDDVQQELSESDGIPVGIANAEPGPALAPVRMVPIVAMVQAGPNGFFEMIGHVAGEEVPFYTRSKHAYALRVRGDSMRPRIRSGQIIVADPDTAYTPEDDVVVKLKSGEYMVKELLIDRRDEIVVTSVNNGERRTIAKADIEYIHCVVDVMRRGL